MIQVFKYLHCHVEILNVISSLYDKAASWYAASRRSKTPFKLNKTTKSIQPLSLRGFAVDGFCNHLTVVLCISQKLRESFVMSKQRLASQSLSPAVFLERAAWSEIAEARKFVFAKCHFGNEATVFHRATPSTSWM